VLGADAKQCSLYFDVPHHIVVAKQNKTTAHAINNQPSSLNNCHEKVKLLLSQQLEQNQCDYDQLLDSVVTARSLLDYIETSIKTCSKQTQQLETLLESVNCTN
jgi:hypothetical protein